MSTDSGGPAFPGEKLIWRGGYCTSEREPTPGMTLRDYFAAQAMKGLLASPKMTYKENENVTEVITHGAYEIADAMLALRKQRGKA